MFNKIYGESADGTCEQAIALGVAQTEEVGSRYKGQSPSRIASFITTLQEHLLYPPLVMAGKFRKRSAAQCGSSSHLVTVQMIVKMTAVAMISVENRQTWRKSRVH